MKNIILLGATLGAALLLAAAPFSFQWSPARTLSLSLDKADAGIGRPLTPMSVAGVNCCDPAEERVGDPHGNSSQGGAYNPDEANPLDMLGAQTEGMIGYMIEQELGNLLPFDVPSRPC